jgi:hypothetical protein
MPTFTKKNFWPGSLGNIIKKILSSLAGWFGQLNEVAWLRKGIPWSKK